MNDFEVLSRDAETKTTEKLKLDVCSKFESIRSELFELNDSVNNAKEEITEAFERFDSAKTYVDRLIAENSKLARSLDDCRIISDSRQSALDDIQALYAKYREEDLKEKRELRREVADAQRGAERFKNALDAALNDVVIWRRAAFWFGVSSALAVVVAIAAFGN